MSAHQPQPGYTVCLSFDFDAMSLWMSMGATAPGTLSRGEYGARVGVPRILELLDRYSITSTFFIPGHTADSFPSVVRETRDRGHEIGHHGYLHENPAAFPTRAEEKAMMERGLEALDRVVGVRPLGFRSPGGDGLGANSVSILEELGFHYDSSLEADDFNPYYARIGDVPHLDRGYEFGKPSRVVEIPISWHLDDVPQFEFISSPGFFTNTLANPSKVYEIWAGDIDYMVGHVPGGVATIQLHPQTIGRGNRMLMLERFIEHCLEHSGLRFGRVGDVAEAYRIKEGELAHVR